MRGIDSRLLRKHRALMGAKIEAKSVAQGRFETSGCGNQVGHEDRKVAVQLSQGSHQLHHWGLLEQTAILPLKWVSRQVPAMC
jgi:hypothetical protein